MSTKELVVNELQKYADDKKANHLAKFFKAFAGGYGQGDKFLGISVPNQRKTAQMFKNLPIRELQQLISSEFHEHRLTAIFILVHQFTKAELDMQKNLSDFYLEHLHFVNNWDLVDSSAHKILGAYLLDKNRTVLYDLANSGDLWKQRVAIISCFQFIRQNDFVDILKISELLLNHHHDLIHKAIGWMLRETGNRNKQVEVDFLTRFYSKMPRTMLRYAIEKFPENERQAFLKGTVNN